MVWITTIDFADDKTSPIMERDRRRRGVAVDGNEYLLEILVRQKLETARALTARHALVAAARPRRSSLAEIVGTALIALGERLGGRIGSAVRGESAPRSCVTPSASHG
jgi:hypothetical protein